MRTGCIQLIQGGGVHRRFSSKAWMQRHKSDQYVKQAVDKDLRSRSAFKLIELQEKYKIIRPDSFVIDLGSSPGGWSVATAGFLRFPKVVKRVVSELDSQPQAATDDKSAIISTGVATAPSTYGLLCSVDLLVMDSVQGDSHFIQGDFRTAEVQDKMRLLGNSRGRKQADCVLSDMLQNVSGQHDVDHFRSIELCQTALEFCINSLKPGGSLLCKFLRYLYICIYIFSSTNSPTNTC